MKAETFGNYERLKPRTEVSQQRRRTVEYVKTILITGASSGFGRDTAETLFRAGHTVFASMRGTLARTSVAEALRNVGIMTVELDVSGDASVEAGVKKVLVDAGKIDVLVTMPASCRPAQPKPSPRNRRRSSLIRMSSGSFASPVPSPLHAPEA